MSSAQLPARILAAVLLLLACTGPAANGGRNRLPGAPDAAPRAALARFVSAIEAQAWGEAYALLSARWRGQLTPAGLGADYVGSGAVGRTAAVRVRALLSSGAPLTVEQDTAVLSVGQGQKAVLVREGDAWRVDALE